MLHLWVSYESVTLTILTAWLPWSLLICHEIRKTLNSQSHTCACDLVIWGCTLYQTKKKEAIPVNGLIFCQWIATDLCRPQKVQAVAKPAFHSSSSSQFPVWCATCHFEQVELILSHSSGKWHHFFLSQQINLKVKYS